MPEIIDQANELEELQRKPPLRNVASTMRRFSYSLPRLREEIPERRRELVAGCQRCADCQEEFEERGKHLR